jgi:hypothetical protein
VTWEDANVYSPESFGHTMVLAWTSMGPQILEYRYSIDARVRPGQDRDKTWCLRGNEASFTHWAYISDPTE